MKVSLIIMTMLLAGCCTPVVIKQEFPAAPAELMKEPNKLKSLS